MTDAILLTSLSIDSPMENISEQEKQCSGSSWLLIVTPQRQFTDVSDQSLRVEVDHLSDNLITIIISENEGRDALGVNLMQVAEQANEAGRIDHGAIVDILEDPGDHTIVVQCSREGKLCTRHIKDRKSAIPANEPKIGAINPVVPARAE